MSIAIASLYCNGVIDVLYNIMTSAISYEPLEAHNPCSLMSSYSKIIDVPNIHNPLFELGSMYVIIHCRKMHIETPQDIFGNERSFILKTCKQNIKSKVHALSCRPYSAMTQITCDDLDRHFLTIAQNTIKNIHTH